jgi:arylsulfatase A-like enzyme
MRPNVLFILVDQLRASSLPAYGDRQIETPNIDRLAREGTTFENAISTCPVCTPYRSMLVTGRHPQTTGMVVNFARIRHDEIGLGDAFARAGYRTGWIGKWHLHTGSFPQVEGQDFVPPGRDRLGFEYWRGYNFHSQYFNGWVNHGDWRNERWEGYETDALTRYAVQFLEGAPDDEAVPGRESGAASGAGHPESVGAGRSETGAVGAGRPRFVEPFCLFVSPHQPHSTPHREYAPDEYYARLPETLDLPENVPASKREVALEMYRHYLAMTLALDDMVGELLGHLERLGLAENTLVVFTSDHGTQAGGHDAPPWAKKLPYEESLRVPLISRLPGVLEAGARRETLVSPVDFFPTLCGLCGVETPRTVEGHDLSAAWRGQAGAFEQDAVFTMNFTAAYDYLVEGHEWRGVRTKSHAYARWLRGDTALHDLRSDPLQQRNLIDDPGSQELRAEMERQLEALMVRRRDELAPSVNYESWFDPYRRIIRNAFGPLGDPEDYPDWSLLAPHQSAASRNT